MAFRTPTDRRVKPIRRVMTVYLEDYTNIPFTGPDKEWIGDMIEHEMQKQYDVVVDTIEIVDAPVV